MNITKKILDNVWEMKLNRFPNEILEISKKCLLDYLGVTLAGAFILKDRGNNLLDSIDSKDDTSSVIGYKTKSNVVTASFINGLSAHAAELDDGMNSGIIHPGSPVISALLPIAEKYNSRGKDLLEAIVVGYEISALLANMIQPSHKLKGYHATGTCGTIGVAVAIAFLLDYSKEEMKNAINTAVVSVSGTLKVLEDNSELKPYNVAKASMNGVISAFMAKSGFEGPDDAFSGSNGFFSMMSDRVDLSYLETSKRNCYFIQKIYVKPYAACRYCHPAIDGALIIKNNNSLQIQKIQQIIVNTYSLAVKNHDHTMINGVSSAKMSIPFSVSVALLTDRAGINEFCSKYINDPIVLSLLDKFTIVADKSFTASFPKDSIAEVEVITYDGKSFKVRVDHPKGEPENPLSDNELETKFRSLACFSERNQKQADLIIDTVLDIEVKLKYLYDLVR